MIFRINSFEFECRERSNFLTHSATFGLTDGWTKEWSMNFQLKFCYKCEKPKKNCDGGTKQLTQKHELHEFQQRYKSTPLTRIEIFRLANICCSGEKYTVLQGIFSFHKKALWKTLKEGVILLIRKKNEFEHGENSMVLALFRYLDRTRFCWKDTSFLFLQSNLPLNGHSFRLRRWWKKSLLMLRRCLSLNIWRTSFKIAPCQNLGSVKLVLQRSNCLICQSFPPVPVPCSLFRRWVKESNL